MIPPSPTRPPSRVEMSGALTPTSDGSLSMNHGLELGVKKRKRDGNTLEELLKDSFVIRPHPSTLSDRPRTLQPLILLPRSHLPLASLDVGSSANALAQSRLFEAHVKILELEERMGSQPMVLIVRLDDGRTLYAVERDSHGLYVLCLLGSWVDLEQLKAAAVVSRQDSSTTSKMDCRSTSIPGPTEAAPLFTPQTSKYSKKKRLAIEAIQSMVKRPGSSLLSEAPPIIPEPELEQRSECDLQVVDDSILDDIATQPTAAEIFENVRNQYFEALYLSKASLAYFAKGPLSRARAAFHLDYDSTLDMDDYINFLQSLVLSTTLIERKYRDGVPDCVSLIDLHDLSADECNKSTGKSKRAKSSKKIKPGKGGLYAWEERLIRRWWANHEDEADGGALGTSKEEMMKSRIAQLRIRETQLQMIMILEILALQPLASSLPDARIGLPVLPTASAADVKGKQPKAKDSDHLTMLIEVHIDRLCIWQSVALEDVKTTLGDVSNPNDIGGSTNLNRHADNILRDFCVEVIAPFFSARLPDRCDAINRKLGGPIVVSPPKPKLYKAASFSGSVSRPGAATKRPVPLKQRRSLKRVLTDDRERRSTSQGPNRAISLMRSATAPTVPGLKREASEAPSLSSVPFTDSAPLHANRGGVLNSKRFFHREVDLSSLAPEGNAKAKKQANIESELKDAISALKKPNRELAGKVLAETAERRSASALHSRKSRKPVRNPFFQGVQISATPKCNRQKDMFAESQRGIKGQMVDDAELASSYPTSLPRIPQSVARPFREALPDEKPLFSFVQATPTRKPVHVSPETKKGFVSVVDYGACPPSSPLMARRPGAQLFNVVPESAAKRPSNYLLPFGIQETPVKERQDAILERTGSKVPLLSIDKENETVGREAGVINGTNQHVGMEQEVSIYKALGWDETDDIDELA